MLTNLLKSRLFRPSAYLCVKECFDQSKPPWLKHWDVATTIVLYYSTARLAVATACVFFHLPHLMRATDAFLYYYMFEFSHWTYQLTGCFAFLLLCLTFLHQLLHLQLVRVPREQAAFIWDAEVVNFEDFLASNGQLWQERVARQGSARNKFRATIKLIVDLMDKGKRYKMIKFHQQSRLVHFPTIGFKGRVNLALGQCCVEYISKWFQILNCKFGVKVV